jgi:16S rRNA (cytosine1402-N4)-methyltransferase
MLFDLGVSSMQLDRPERGFSFRNDAALDMRMDPSRGESAAALLARIEEPELRRIISRWGEERHSGAIARAIVREREKRALVRTGQLAELIDRIAGPAARRWKIHPATRTFQALRIAVNGEIEGLEQLVTDAVATLPRGGRLAVISYHSLEDRAIKTSMRSLANRCSCPPKLPVCGCGKEDLIRVLTRRPVRPGEEEIDRNPRARSARLRVAERL